MLEMNSDLLRTGDAMPHAVRDSISDSFSRRVGRYQRRDIVASLAFVCAVALRGSKAVNYVKLRNSLKDLLRCMHHVLLTEDNLSGGRKASFLVILCALARPLWPTPVSLAAALSPRNTARHRL